MDEANGQDRTINILQPLGLDPGLPKLQADRAAHVARECGFPPEAFTVILLAHGSRLNPASRKAIEWLASEFARRAVCRDVKIAVPEEPPHLQDTMQSTDGPAIVMGSSRAVACMEPGTHRGSSPSSSGPKSFSRA
jgi:sirohydrochlorin cobaltochelatase